MICKISDCFDILGGGTPKTSNPEYWNGDIPWLSVKDFSGDLRYVYSTEKSITRLGLENSSTQLLQKDDIIISARGTVGELAMIPFPMAFNQSCYGLRAHNDVDKTFLYYLLRDSIKKLKKGAHGSVFDTLTRESFDLVKVMLPDLPTQRKIAHVLSTIDDKIELNNRINDNLFTNQLRSPDNSFGSNVSRNSANRWFSKNVDWIFLNNGKTNSLNSFALFFDGITTFISASPPSQTA